MSGQAPSMFWASCEVVVSGLDSALLPDGGVRSVGRNKGPIVAEAKIEGQLRRGLPGVLNEQTHHPAGASRLMYISTVSTIGNVQQEGRQGGARLGGLPRSTLRVPRLPACE